VGADVKADDTDFALRPGERPVLMAGMVFRAGDGLGAPSVNWVLDDAVSSATTILIG
jgi:hypothetical protein